MNQPTNKTKRLYQAIGEQLYAELARGHYQVGDRLPPERDIAERLGVSRAIVRDALIMLELMALVEVRKGSGIYVLQIPDAPYTAQNLRAEYNTIEDAGPFEMMQARQLIESHVAEFAATQVTKNDILRMREALELEREHLQNNNANYDGDRLFHLAIAEATQNSVLVDTVADLWAQRERSPMWRQLHAHIIDQSYRRKWLLDHDLILQALQRRDPLAARDAMWQHLENVKQVLLQLSPDDHPDFDGHLFNKDPVHMSPSS